MITLNIVDRGADDATLEYIVKSVPTERLPQLLQTLGIETHTETEGAPLEKSQALDLIKARKIRVGAPAKNKSKTVQKVKKMVLVHPEKGRPYYREQVVNADVAENADLVSNKMRTFDEHVARTRAATTAHITGEAADMEELLSTPEGQQIVDAINASIGSGSPSGKLTKNLNYTNIRFCTDPVEGYDEDGNEVHYGCVAIAKNPKTGKDQYFYSKQFRDAHKADSIQRAMALASPKISASVRAVLDSPDMQNDIGDCLRLMYEHGMKAGNELGGKGNQLGKFRTSGATTLTAGNLTITKLSVKDPVTGKKKMTDAAVLQFYQQGEKGDMEHQQSITITDPAFFARLKAKKEAAEDDNARLFDCTAADTLAVCHELFDCNNEDLRNAYGIAQGREARRTIMGTNTFLPNTVTTKDKTTDKTKRLTFKQMEMKVADVLMYALGVTDKRSVEPFMNKRLIKLYQENSSKNTLPTKTITALLKQAPALEVKQLLEKKGYHCTEAQTHKINLAIQEDKKAKEAGQPLPYEKAQAKKKKPEHIELKDSGKLGKKKVAGPTGGAA